MSRCSAGIAILCSHLVVGTVAGKKYSIEDETEYLSHSQSRTMPWTWDGISAKESIKLDGAVAAPLSCNSEDADLGMAKEKLGAQLTWRVGWDLEKCGDP